MITFLWMLYLALTLLFTISITYQVLINLVHKQKDDTYSFIMRLITCLLWSIWYFYYLN
jgi:hypothetical protein